MVIEGLVEEQNSSGGRQKLDYMKQIDLDAGCRKHADVKMVAENRRG